MLPARIRQPYSYKYESCCPFRNERMVGSTEGEHCVFSYLQLHSPGFLFIYIWPTDAVNTIFRVLEKHFKQNLSFTSGLVSQI